jgi:hypothetical protein
MVAQVVPAPVAPPPAAPAASGTVSRDDVLAILELRAKLPPGKTLRDAVEFYLACREKLAA